MNEERQALSAFLSRQQIRYCNPAGVIFYRIADGSLFVATGYPGVEQTAAIWLEFSQHFDPLTQFIAVLHISDPGCPADVMPQDLLSLYEDELLDIICTLKGRRTREMSFRKLGELIWASNTKKKMHHVKIPIHQPEDLVVYTLQYYDMGGITAKAD